MVEFSPATREARIRFPANAIEILLMCAATEAMLSYDVHYEWAAPVRGYVCKQATVLMLLIAMGLLHSQTPLLSLSTANKGH